MKDYFYQPAQMPDPRFSDLRLDFCGMETCAPLHSWGPAVRPNYIIHYILKGRGVFQVGGESWTLHEREGFLIEPEVQTFYQADPLDPWTYAWIGFDGKLAPVLLGELGLGESRLTFCCEQKEALKEVFLSLFEKQQYSEVNELILQSQLYRFFAILMQDCQIADRPVVTRKNDYVQAAIRFIRTNYFRPIHVEDVADYVGINRSYLYVLFKEETGMCPREYLTTFRLTRAAQLLKISNFSVESIACSCGYQDALVFSKAFKQKYQITPLKYRRQKALSDG